MTKHAIRASLLYFNEDPRLCNQAISWYSDGLLIIEDNHILASGDYQTLIKDSLYEGTIIDHSGKIIMPGLIDTHIHYPQTDIICSPSEGLIPWLNNYTFPTERNFGDYTYSSEI